MNKSLRKKYCIRKCKLDFGESVHCLQKKHHCGKGSIYQSNSKKNLESKPPRQNSVSRLEPYKEAIEAWLLAKLNNAKRNKRISITALHIHLTATYPEFSASSTGLGYFVKKLRQTLESKSGSFLTLVHDPHECQADFGNFYYFDANGVKREGECVALSFPASGACYLQVFPGKSAESMIKGMQNIFYHVGGVPRDIWLDNDPCFVGVFVVNKKKERRMIPPFKSFVEHYGFKPVFMSSYAGNEKGAVENALGYLRRNLLVPLPIIADFDEFNRGLLLKCETLFDREHFRKTFRIPDKFKDDLSSFLPLPQKPFVCEVVHRCFVDQFGCIRVANTRAYYVDPKYRKTSVNVRLSHSHCTITADDSSVLYDDARLYRQELQPNLDLSAMLPLLAKNPHSIAVMPLVRSLPRSVQLFICTAFPKDLSEFVRNMAMICKMSDMQKTALVAEVCATERKFSKKDFIRAYESLE